MSADQLIAAVAAIRAGQAVILPTDTVYGLVADAYREGPGRLLYELKGRPEGQPVALLAADLDTILDAVPELRGRAAVTARALLPGPYTLVLPNPAARFRWLCGGEPRAIGIRVPELPEPVRAAPGISLRAESEPMPPAGTSSSSLDPRRSRRVRSFRRR